MRFTLVLAVGGAGAGWGGLWLDIVGIDEGQTQLTALSSLGVFFFLSFQRGQVGGQQQSCFNEAKVT